jgi:hypothetical protein
MHNRGYTCFTAAYTRSNTLLQVCQLEIFLQMSAVRTSTCGEGTTSHFMPGTCCRTLTVPTSLLWVNWNARSC